LYQLADDISICFKSDGVAHDFLSLSLSLSLPLTLLPSFSNVLFKEIGTVHGTKESQKEKEREKRSEKE
jgi:hypothetical protein